MQIAENTARSLNPVIRGLATAGSLPKTEANSVIKLLLNASKVTRPDTHKQKPVMVTAKQAGERLGVCTKTILRMREAGELKGVRLTGSVKSLRFPESEIEKFLNVGA